MRGYNPITARLMAQRKVETMPIDRSKYPDNWEQLSWSIRMERAGNHCEWCGAENHKPHPVTGSYVVLTVAHLDRNPANNDETNLAALCQRCHLNHDRPVNLETMRRRRLEKEAEDRVVGGQLKLIE